MDKVSLNELQLATKSLAVAAWYIFIANEALVFCKRRLCYFKSYSSTTFYKSLGPLR